MLLLPLLALLGTCLAKKTPPYSSSHLAKSAHTLPRTLKGVEDQRPLKRTINGADMRIEQMNAIVQIYDPKFVCAGTLFSARYVLTAAHCFRTGQRLDQITVRAGETHVVPRFTGLPVLGLTRHPEFSPLNAEHDIAILRMRDPIMHSSKINYLPICSKPYAPGSQVTIAGWEARDMSQALKSSSVAIEAPEECESKLNESFVQLPSAIICVSKGLCYGDSGDPLIYENQVCGIGVAFHGCGEEKGNGKLPDVFTDVYLNRDFIAQAVLQLDQKAKQVTAKPGAKPKAGRRGIKNGA